MARLARVRAVPELYDCAGAPASHESRERQERVERLPYTVIHALGNLGIPINQVVSKWPSGDHPNRVHRPQTRLSRARLLPNCAGKLKIIAAILEQPVIEKIVTHLDLQARAPPRAPARGPQLQAA